jgi:hypothetical protein
MVVQPSSNILLVKLIETIHVLINQIGIGIFGFEEMVFTFFFKWNSIEALSTDLHLSCVVLYRFFWKWFRS